MTRIFNLQSCKLAFVLSAGLYLQTRGVDFDDLEYGFKEEDKPTEKVRILTTAFILCTTNRLVGPE